MLYIHITPGGQKQKHNVLCNKVSNCEIKYYLCHENVGIRNMIT